MRKAEKMHHIVRFLKKRGYLVAAVGRTRCLFGQNRTPELVIEWLCDARGADGFLRRMSPKFDSYRANRICGRTLAEDWREYKRQNRIR